MVKRPPGLIYNEADIDAVVRTMLGEAANQGDDGLAAVAHVLRNRLENGGYGASLYDVAHAPKQFSAWNSKGLGGNSLVNTSTDSASYQKARAIAEEVLNGRRTDNTGGAVNYFAPKGMTGKNGTVKGEPDWASRMSYTTSIGGHRFYSDDSAAGAAEKLANGSNVASVQQQLAQRGFDPGAIDGINGPRTTAAIKAFQTANGLDPDGVVGPLTRAALEGQARPRTQPQPPLGSRQPANILPPGPLIQPQDIRDAFFNPLPAPAPLVAPPPIPQAGGSGLQETRFGPRPTPQAPMPMPGRPGSLNAQAPGVPTPGRPAGLNAAPPPSVPSVAAPKLLRLPSGAMIAPGVYDNAKSGIPYTVTEGPNGTAVINSQRSGFVDLGREINAPTILGGIIRSKIPEVAQDAMNNFAPAMDNVKSTAANAINSAVPMVQGFGNTIGGMFGGLFGGQPSGPQYQPGMMGRGLPTPQAPSPLMPSPMLRAVPQVPARRQQTRAERFTNLDEWGNIR